MHAVLCTGGGSRATGGGEIGDAMNEMLPLSRAMRKTVKLKPATANPKRTRVTQRRGRIWHGSIRILLCRRKRRVEMMESRKENGNLFYLSLSLFLSFFIFFLQQKIVYQVVAISARVRE
jgi:hypothetical protein